jgi:acyl-CoA synthetase (AMP-forming)/AMP-acid ligase II
VLKIVDDNDNEVSAGTMGEIYFRTKTTVERYWKKPEETAETFKAGWFHTGDMGRMDEEGYVYILDRKKDIIVSGAENISARAVEDVIYAHPAVLECAVIGVPSEKWGEEVKAIVVPRQGMTVTPEEIIEHCRDKMAGFKRPKSAEIWQELPKNPTGKILKKEIRAMYRTGDKR